MNKPIPFKKEKKNTAVEQFRDYYNFRAWMQAGVDSYMITFFPKSWPALLSQFSSILRILFTLVARYLGGNQS